MSTGAANGAPLGSGIGPWGEQVGRWLLDVTVERPLFDQLQDDVDCVLEDGVQPGTTGDDGGDRDLQALPVQPPLTAPYPSMPEKPS